MSERREIFLVSDPAGGAGNASGDASVDAARDARPEPYRLGELFAGHGHQVRLITVNGRGGRRPEPGLETTVLPARSRRRAASRLGAILRSARPGAVVIVTDPAAMELVGRADVGGLRVVGVQRVPYEVAKNGPEYERSLRVFAQADRFVALTREDADGWARAGLSNADAVPDWADAAPGDAAPSDPAGPAGQVVLGPSSLTHDKGADLLLESWSRVAPRQPSWRLRFHGAGPEEAELRRMAADLGIEGSVEFHPPAADPRSVLATAAIFALPSRAEIFPADLVTAMGHGLPVVAFDCSPGVRDVVGDEVDGLLVDPGHTEQFALALERLMTDEPLREKLGHGARESVDRFGPAAVAARWERLFDLLHR